MCEIYYEYFSPRIFQLERAKMKSQQNLAQQQQQQQLVCKYFLICEIFVNREGCEVALFRLIRGEE